MNTKIKICGIRTFDTAEIAVASGAHFLGFNFVPSSKRYINPSQALKIISLIKGKVKVVGIFQNAEINYVNKIASDLKLDFVQLHGSEDNKFISKINLPVIKSVSVNDQIQKIRAEYFLLDRVKRGKGEMVNLKEAVRLARDFPIFFAGGLKPENVTGVIKTVRPFAVDVAGGVETNGVLDHQKIKLFIKKAKEII